MVSQNSSKLRRILTIDGGGIKGIFPASFLSTLEEAINDRVSNYFDLIVGTSTGGIIALGLGSGMTAKEILEMYEEFGEKVFSGNKIINILKHFFVSKYNSIPLEKALRNKFGDKKFGECNNRLVIPCTNLDTGEVHIYKTSHNKRLEVDYKKEIVEIALQTAAAPTYFPPHIDKSNIPLIDGGIWANNPVSVAVVEAIALLNWDANKIKILSLGCTQESIRINYLAKLLGGKLFWAEKVADIFITAQSHAALGAAKLLLGNEEGDNRLLRISPLVPNNRFKLDSTDEISSLKGLGATEARKQLPMLRDSFFYGHVEPFIPVHKLKDTKSIV